MTMTLQLGSRTGTDMGDDGREYGPLAKTIITIADYAGKPPETQLIEPYSERQTTVAEYILPFKNEKTGVSGYKVNPDVLPLDVLGVYLIHGRRFPQVQVIFEAQIDVERVNENLAGDGSGIQLIGRAIKLAATTLLVINKECAVITVGRTNPRFLNACECIEAIYNSGSFCEKESDGSEPMNTSGKRGMELRQQMDLRMDTRLAVIEKMEGTMRTEQRMEARQIMAIRLAHVSRASTDKIRDELAAQTEEATGEDIDKRRDEIAKQTEDARKAYRTVVRALANRIMRETPTNARPRNFGAAINLAHRLVNGTRRKQTSS